MSFVGAATAADVGLRALPVALWSGPARETVDDSVAAAVDEAARRELDVALARHWAAATAIGDARASAEGMRLTTDGLLHVGYRTSRFEIQRTEFGADKTVFSVLITGSLFFVNLGTAEVLAARTVTGVAQSEKQGRVATLDRDQEFALVEDATALAVRTLAAELAEKVALGEVQASVAGQLDPSRVVLAHGRLDGAYRGEGFTVPTEDGLTARVHSVQERLSVALLSRASQLPSGTVLARPDTRGRGGDAPRILVHLAGPDATVAPGVGRGELIGWVEDGLASAGFTVVPSSGALLVAQLSEAAAVDIAESVLVGAQAVPDIVVRPTVFNVLEFEEHDEERRTDLHVLEAGLSLAFVGLQTSTVGYGVFQRVSRSEAVQKGGRAIDVGRAFKGLLKDAALAATAEAGVGFRIGYAEAVLTTPPGPNGWLSWDAGDTPLGGGSVAEVFRMGREFHDPADGRSLGRLEELVGTVAVHSSGADRETGRVLAAAIALAPGMRLRAVSSGRQEGQPVLALGRIALTEGSIQVPESSLTRSVEVAMDSAAGFRGAASNADRSFFESVRAELGSGTFAQDSDDTLAPFTGLPASHTLDLRVHLAAGELESRGKVLERVFTVTLEADMLDARDGSRIRLVDPKGKEWATYQMWKKRTLRAKQRRGELAVGLSDADAPDQLEKLLVDSVVELLRRLGIMVGQ